MKFGKEFTNHLEETIPEWRDKFLCYKLLKKLLKRLPSSTVDSLPHSFDFNRRLSAADGGAGASRPLGDLQDWFVGILNDELEKLNDFYVDKEEDFIIRFQVWWVWLFCCCWVWFGWMWKWRDVRLNWIGWLPDLICMLWDLRKYESFCFCQNLDWNIKFMWICNIC